MSDDTARAGLGKVIYSTTEDKGSPPPDDEKATAEEVEEGSEESFPASDPPSYMGSTSTSSE